MPIGTVDYVSTAPWNDPMNPWPAYSRISLSAIDTDLGAGVMQTLNLVFFDPVNQYVTYSNKALGAMEQINLELNGTTWAVTYDGDPQYQLAGVTSRGIPAGDVQGNYNWEAVDGDDAATLSIVPVTTWLNPWEYRRRRLLEMC